jgi:hypothetical protein
MFCRWTTTWCSGVGGGGWGGGEFGRFGQQSPRDRKMCTLNGGGGGFILLVHQFSKY